MAAMDFSGAFYVVLGFMWAGIVFTILGAMVKNVQIRRESRQQVVPQKRPMGTYGRTSSAPGG
jgi:hypothetical protein